jgi:hypothetical protein
MNRSLSYWIAAAALALSFSESVRAACMSTADCLPGGCPGTQVNACVSAVCKCIDTEPPAPHPVMPSPTPGCRIIPAAGAFSCGAAETASYFSSGSSAGVSEGYECLAYQDPLDTGSACLGGNWTYGTINCLTSGSGGTCIVLSPAFGGGGPADYSSRITGYVECCPAPTTTTTTTAATTTTSASTTTTSTTAATTTSTTIPGCFPNGDPCLGDSECCSSYCAGSVCADLPPPTTTTTTSTTTTTALGCLINGDACLMDSQCCSGSCAGLLCGAVASTTTTALSTTTTLATTTTTTTSTTTTTNVCGPQVVIRYRIRQARTGGIPVTLWEGAAPNTQLLKDIEGTIPVDTESIRNAASP